MEINTQQNAERREFLRGALTAAGGAALVGAVAAVGLGPMSPAHAAVSPPLSFKDIPTLKLLNLPGLMAGEDVKVLNYALTLEDLEADLYQQCIMRLTTGGVNGVGKTIPGLGLNALQPDVAYVLEFAPVEAKHRDFLRQSLNSLFSGLATRSFRYDFGIENKSRPEVLDLLLTVERTGLQAYLGAVPKLKTKLFVTAAAAIQGTEARHTTVLTIVQNHLYNGATPKPVAPLASDNHGIDVPLDPDVVLAQVSPFIVK